MPGDVSFAIFASLLSTDPCRIGADDFGSITVKSMNSISGRLQKSRSIAAPVSSRHCLSKQLRDTALGEAPVPWVYITRAPLDLKPVAELAKRKTIRPSFSGTLVERQRLNDSATKPPARKPREQSFMVFRHGWHPEGDTYNQPELHRTDSLTYYQNFLRSQVGWGAPSSFAALSNSGRCQKLSKRCGHSRRNGGTGIRLQMLTMPSERRQSNA